MKKIGWITGKKKLLRLAGLSLMGVLLLSGCGNTGKSAVAATSSTSASETSNEAGKGSKVSQPAENVDAQVAEASLPQPGEAISASLAWKSRMELAYATQFAVDTYEDADGMQYEAVSVADGSRFLLIPEGGKVPEDLPDSIQVLKRPVKQIYLVATATMDMFRMLGALPDIRFSGTDASGWYIPEAKEAMENGSILYAGKYSEPDYERIVSEGCGLAIENTMILHSPEVKEKLESYLEKGNISAIVYSNPNNPSWICLKEEELHIIGELATKYDVIVLEDLAYFAMDFRQDLSKPFQPPYQPSVAHYTDNYVLLISGSKAFSYAGQRIGVSCISNKLYHRSYPGLTKRYGGGTFGTVFIHRVLYALSSGTSHSAQYALAAMLKAANEGQYNFLDEVKIYGERAHKLKEIFLRHGFHLVYDNDLGNPVADGFYFTIGYPGMTSGELAKELMYYGVSAISLITTGSHQEGLRACTSFIQDHQYAQLEERMAIFAENHPVK